MIRHAWISAHADVTQKRQCVLAGMSRTTVDWYSRLVLSWRISNSMEAAFCVDYLEYALLEHGKPEVIKLE